MDWHDVQQAKLTEEIGLKQPVEYTEDEKRTIATHEAGHAVVAYLVGHGPQARGAVDHQAHATRSACSRTPTPRSASRAPAPSSSASMQIAFGGMTAEELFFGESGTGPAATSRTRRRIAAQMVGSFGMAGSLVSFEAIEAGPITQGIVGKVLANDDARARGRAAARPGQGRRAARCSTTTGTSSIALRDELLEREELVGDEIIDVLREAESAATARRRRRRHAMVEPRVRDRPKRCGRPLEA